MGSPSPSVGSSNISFLGLRNNWNSVGTPGGSDPGTTNISLAEFRGATFTDGTTVPGLPGSGEEISINDDFKGKTFGTSASPEFEWYYYAYGSNTGTIYIYWLDSGGALVELRTISGQQHTGQTQSWDEYTEDLSSYSGQTGRIVIAYKTGSNFRQDIQLDNMELKETTEVGGTVNLDPGTFLGRSNWQRYINNNGYTTSLSYSSNDSNWSSISISTASNNRWNYDKGGTPSGSTGGTRDVAGSTSGYYLYFEGSHPNYSSSNRYYWLRTGEYTLS
mgnify:CR=1 FL=1